ncbi:MAG: sodium-dependent transporter [Acutalibacteraceae bacterium]
MKHERSNFSSRIGFVLAASGSAVGLGNIWRFPYLAAQYGGGIFLLVYLILAVTFGFTLMITEIAIGRKTKLSCIGAYKKLDKRFGFLGWIASIIPVIIVPYYCVIGGWILKYLAEFLTGGGSAVADNAENYFNNFISAGQNGILQNPMLWFVLFVLANSAVVIFGVQKGIEKVSKIVMPILVVLSIVVAAFALTMPGALDGVKYYLMPDFSKFSPMTVLAAMGQLFYSMSLAMGIMITYGSYMKKEDDLERSVTQIEIFDTLIAFIAGLMIIPAVFAFSGGDESALGKGPGLMFITLPKVFEQMQFGQIIGTVFFLLVLFAALTSSISLMETVVSIIQDKLHWGRIKSTVVVTIGILLLGTLSCLGYGPLSAIQIFGKSFLDFFDFISNSLLMPVVALLTCILIGRVVGTKFVSDEVRLSGKFRREKLFKVMVRWIAPICIIAILLASVAEGMGWLNF